MVFHLTLSDSMSPHVFRTLLSILANLNNALVWMNSTRVISNSPSRFTKSLVTVRNPPIRYDINDTFMFHSFFQFPSNVQVLISFFSIFYNFFNGLLG